MIRLDLRHLGLPAKTFGQACKKAQPLLDRVFAQASKPGYAFLELPDDGNLVREILAFKNKQNKHRWEEILVLGIGGSALGLIAIRDALLNPFGSKPRLWVLDNIDPVFTAGLLHHLNLKKTLCIVISKSGTTAEPMALYAILKKRLKKSQFVFVTDPKAGLLRDIAKREGIATFPVPPKVGGRFSVLSAVGLLPAALAGVDIRGLMAGAKTMRELLKKTKGQKNLALALAVAQFELDRRHDKPMTVMMPYANALFRAADWYRQLLAESIGKNEKSGPTPINALGTTDQHSQLQLWNEGPNNKFFIFLRLRDFARDLAVGKLPGEMAFLSGKSLGEVMSAAADGTIRSLAKNGRPVASLELDCLDARTLGALFMLFEVQVALLGLLCKVNTFDQPGVESSKGIMKRALLPVHPLQPL